MTDEDRPITWGQAVALALTVYGILTVVSLFSMVAAKVLGMTALIYVALKLLSDPPEDSQRG